MKTFLSSYELMCVDSCYTRLMVFKTLIYSTFYINLRI